MLESVKNNWGTRELERQINSLLYERLALSKDREKVLEFYNYVLKCFVRIDLKVGKLTHQDIGQLDTFIKLNIDILIAAKAIENNSKLVTRDEGYENIKGLEAVLY